MNGGVKVVILVGGENRATRFRPLSLNIPKPLFPIAGKAMIAHHIEACKQLDNLEEILILGSFEESKFTSFINDMSRKHNVKISYLKEMEPLGTAGGLFHFRERIVGPKTQYIFVLHSDICCTFPLNEILTFHNSHMRPATMMGTKVPPDLAINFGCYVADENTHEMRHYVEKPETFVSDSINCGIYCFSPIVFSRPVTKSQSRTSLFDWPLKESTIRSSKAVSMERDVIPGLVQRREIFVYPYNDFWRCVKNACSAVYCNDRYLEYYEKVRPELLIDPSTVPYQVVGRIVIDPSAKIDPTAKVRLRSSFWFFLWM